MILVADANVPNPVIEALLAVRLDVKRAKEVAEGEKDRAVMQACLELAGMLLTFDRGIPSQAYLFEFAKNGLTVVLMRWKKSTPRDWQQMVEISLRDAHLWEEAACREPCVISVSYRGSRVRPWSEISPLIVAGAVSREANQPRQKRLF